MKKTLILLLFLNTLFLFAQKNYKEGVQPFQKPKEGKALVYILKSGAGALVNFRAYKDDKFLGVLTSSNYLIVECDPGQHLFWATSENRDFVETNLEADKVYVLNAEGRMGAFVAQVGLVPLDPKVKSNKNLFARKIKNSTAVVYNQATPPSDDKSENISKGLAKYEELKNKNSGKISKLNSDLTFEDADKFIKN